MPLHWSVPHYQRACRLTSRLAVIPASLPMPSTRRVSCLRHTLTRYRLAGCLPSNSRPPLNPRSHAGGVGAVPIVLYGCSPVTSIVMSQFYVLYLVLDSALANHFSSSSAALLHLQPLQRPRMTKSIPFPIPHTSRAPPSSIQTSPRKHTSPPSVTDIKPSRTCAPNSVRARSF